MQKILICIQMIEMNYRIYHLPFRFLSTSCGSESSEMTAAKVETQAANSLSVSLMAVEQSIIHNPNNICCCGLRRQISRCRGNPPG